MEFVLGALAASGAVIISNPFDVIKTRMQLQGELKSRGQFSVTYKNVFHAFYSVAKVDGILALQKGLPPAVCYQVVLNGTRFGLYHKILDSSFITLEDGSVSSLGCIASGATVGVIGGFVASPFYLAKTQLQVQANEAIAVGFQHQHKNGFTALKDIFKTTGIQGLWRGSSTAIPRAGVGSTVQLFVYSKSKDWLDMFDVCHRDSWQSTLFAAFISGICITVCMSPFDLISTRVYNQELDSKGKGLLYRGVVDCFLKTLRTEGLRGLYKGSTALYCRIGPHSFFNILFWDNLKKLHREYKTTEEL